jgi:hypothetical protein
MKCPRVHIGGIGKRLKLYESIQEGCSERVDENNLEE